MVCLISVGTSVSANTSYVVMCAVALWKLFQKANGLLSVFNLTHFYCVCLHHSAVNHQLAAAFFYLDQFFVYLKQRQNVMVGEKQVIRSTGPISSNIYTHTEKNRVSLLVMHEEKKNPHHKYPQMQYLTMCSSR